MEASTNRDRAKKDMDLSFLAIRKSVGVLGIALPIVLALGTLILCDDCQHFIKESISSYYYTLMGNFLTGILCAVALFLFTYKGYNSADRISAIIAGTGALVTAVFPTNSDNTSKFCELITKPASTFSNTAHFLGAAVFFVTLAFMSIFLFTKSNKKKEDIKKPKRNRNRVYIAMGIIMLVALIGIVLLRIPAVEQALGAYHPEFWFETIALWAFGFSWLVKGETILKD
jgi:hypothetical protein